MTTATLEVTRDEADLILDGLVMLLNSKRFGFKEPDEDALQVHADLYAAVARFEAFFQQSFGR
mgnify:CR=1 FL=1